MSSICRIPLGYNHELALWSVHWNKRENTRKVGFLSQVYNPVKEFWTETKISLKITEPSQPDQPTADKHPMEKKLITFQTVAKFLSLLVFITTDNKTSSNSFRPHYYQRSALVDLHIVDTYIARKQSPPKLWDSDTKGKFHFNSTREVVPSS